MGEQFSNATKQLRHELIFASLYMVRIMDLLADLVITGIVSHESVLI